MKRKFTKQPVMAANSAEKQNLLSFLHEKGIDTTKHKYELFAQEYERFGSGGTYKKVFSCPGDYLAYFSMLLHKGPTYDELIGYFGDWAGLEDFIEQYPTLDDIADHAHSYWWGDGRDFIIYLKNLDTGEYLMGPQEFDEYEEYDGWD